MCDIGTICFHPVQVAHDMPVACNIWAGGWNWTRFLRPADIKDLYRILLRRKSIALIRFHPCLFHRYDRNHPYSSAWKRWSFPSKDNSGSRIQSVFQFDKCGRIPVFTSKYAWHLREETAFIDFLFLEKSGGIMMVRAYCSLSIYNICFPANCSLAFAVSVIFFGSICSAESCILLCRRFRRMMNLL